MAALNVRLTFPTELVSEPVIYNLGRDYNIITNIRRANVTQDSAWAILQMTGDTSELEKALEYLKNINVKIEHIKNA